ncbi:MAG TPA: YceH family protein [Chthoniobacterales bacterium]
MTLSSIEIRILGCLLEKERLTPENYPLSINALTNACNQSTNRDPVVAFDEKAVDDALFALREKKFATVVFGAGSRVQKYRHNLPDHFELTRQETALLTVLLLRGPQTPGELRQRTDRLAGFPGGLDEVEKALDDLAAGGDPLVRVLPARPGQKERRYVQLLGGEPDMEALNAAISVDLPPSTASQPTRIDRLEAELAALRAEFEAFKKQFES